MKSAFIYHHILCAHPLSNEHRQQYTTDKHICSLHRNVKISVFLYPVYNLQLNNLGQLDFYCIFQVVLCAIMFFKRAPEYQEQNKCILNWNKHSANNTAINSTQELPQCHFKNFQEHLKAHKYVKTKIKLCGTNDKINLNILKLKITVDNEN